MYVIQRNDGQFVTPKNSRLSYTKNVSEARGYISWTIAKADLCPKNEKVVDVKQFYLRRGLK